MNTEQLAGAAAASYPLLALSVLLGSLVPVIPTGAVVSAATALAVHGGDESLVLVLLAATVAAYLGDCVTYAVARGGLRGLPRALTRRLGTVDPAAIQRLHEHGWQVLVVARLVPAGRIPALAAAGLTRYPWPRFLPAQALAALTWAAMYGVFGLVGGSAFANPLVGMLAAVLGVLIVTALVRLAQGWWSRRRPAGRDTVGQRVLAPGTTEHGTAGNTG
jgi:membrane protein DedA with SNARE-associated domain